MCARISLLMAVGAVLACGGGEAATQAPTSESGGSDKVSADNGNRAGEDMSRKQPRTEQGELVAGPGIESAEELLAWFEAHGEREGKRTRFRVPVVVSFEDEYRLGLGEVFVGGHGDASAGRLRLHLDDGGLSVAFLDTVRARCPKEQPSCALWVEGFWGHLIEGDFPRTPGTWPFAVLAVGESIEPGQEVRVMVVEARR